MLACILSLRYTYKRQLSYFFIQIISNYCVVVLQKASDLLNILARHVSLFIVLGNTYPHIACDCEITIYDADLCLFFYLNL